MLTQKHFDTRFPLLGFAARSGTGKTTLLTALIPRLKSTGLRIGLIKHTHHRVTFDNAGLSRDLFAKGIDVYADSESLSIYETHRQSEADNLLADTLTANANYPLDLMLVEGFKHIAFSNIELHRDALNQPLLYDDDPSVIAIASDVPDKIKALNSELDVLDLNNVDSVFDWIINRYLKQQVSN